jgi:hypothetical protein
LIVKDLLEAGALVEIEATAEAGDGATYEKR